MRNLMLKVIVDILSVIVFFAELYFLFSDLTKLKMEGCNFSPPK